MKVKLFIMSVVIIMLTMSVQSFAQMRGNPQLRLKKSLEQYKTRLKLTDVQYKKVDSILTSQMDEIMKLRESANGDFSSMREKMMPIREKTDRGIESLLIPEQKVEYKKILDERAERMKSMQRN